jgi:eukaryotic-like serine/threonine-protein kinase
MSRDRNDEVERIYHDALERDRADRDAFLTEACAGDQALRREVVSLLAHEDQADRFLSTPALELTARAVVGMHIGQRVGPYTVASRIGAGGMGEVYRARDSKLGRDVALKILPGLFAADPDRLARFKREAQVLASLNHPNIAAIYGFEDSDGVQALVLELVDGPTLEERTAAGPLPLGDALPIARQVCDALEAAHGLGIIHRDLKPANIKVKPDGTVKVLDFGLAKAWEPLSGVPADMSASPTMPGPATTAMGVILGTAAYMSPEQAKGRPVDKRSDIWGFGCVLYEMLTGANAFAGEDIPDTLAQVLMKEPDWTALPALTPVSIRRLLRRCLDKDRARRLADIADARIEIDEAIATPEAIAAAPSGPRQGSRWKSTVPWMVAAVLAVVCVVLAMRTDSRRAALLTRSVIRLEINLPPAVEPYVNAGRNLALSPDGTRLAFVGILGGIRQLYVRHLDQFDAAPIRGTENANSCFFSPDGAAIGFISSDRTLKKVTLADGLVVPLVRDVDFGGGAWGADDRITFVRAGTLWQIPASGGSARQLTMLDGQAGELSEAWPTAIAGGKAILFTSITGSRRDAAHIEAVSVSTGRRQLLLQAGSFPLYATTGHLIFFRGGSLLAAPFDIGTLQATGTPVRILENLPLDTTSGAPLVAVSDSGSIVYPPAGAATSRLVWVSRQGLEQPITDIYRAYQAPRLSPDGRRIIVQSGGDLWVQDTAHATFVRLTSDETVGNSYPVWAPDGTRVVFRTRTGLRSIDADGGRPSEAIPDTAVTDFPSSISPDGKTLAVSRITADMSADVDVLSLEGEPKPHPIVRTSGFDGGAQFSPDGRWMAYASDDSGLMQVYVRPFPGPERKWQVSTDGGTAPRWNRNGKELFYRNGNKMMTVSLSAGPELASSSPRILFDLPYAFGANVTLANYDVSADGQRFVMVKDAPGSGRLSVVLNWFDELARLSTPAAR